VAGLNFGYFAVQHAERLRGFRVRRCSWVATGELICPTSGFSETLSSPLAKNILLYKFCKSEVGFARPALISKGRIAIVTNVERGMRWT
jgi:hypothetical protein